MMKTLDALESVIADHPNDADLIDESVTKDAWGNEITYDRIDKNNWKLTTEDPDGNIICKSSKDKKYCKDDEEQEDEE